MRHISTLILAGAVLRILAPIGDAQARPVCPRPATQADVLNDRFAVSKRLKFDGKFSEAVANVYACQPPHPVLGGPAKIAFQDVNAAPSGHAFLRFKVTGLSDMYLAYLVDGRGKLLQAFVTGP